MPDNAYFGEPWNPSIAKGEQAPTPLGAPCLFCKEAIKEGDQGMLMPYIALDPSRQEVMARLAVPVHLECLLRQAYGSVAHQQRRCACFGGDGEDHPGLTKREAAKAAVAYYEKLHKSVESFRTFDDFWKHLTDLDPSLADEAQ